MRVHVLHHAACFDGAASAAVFTAFYRVCVRDDAEFVYIPKAHQQGDPFTDADFDADDSAIVDFRYTQRPALTWYFDHHRSAFQLADPENEFETLSVWAYSAGIGQQARPDDLAPLGRGREQGIGGVGVGRQLVAFRQPSIASMSTSSSMMGLVT